jgi:lipopolysaccharide export system protein LptA
MVKINFPSHFYNNTLIRHIFYALFFLSISSAIYSQDNSNSRRGKKKIEIIHADEWQVNAKINKDLQRLLGNVLIKHKDVTMTCDSAYYYKNTNKVRAFSKVHIEQGDTLDLYGDYLLYDGTTELASVDGNVELIDKETHLYSDSIDYDVKNKIAWYDNHGRITNAENILTSIIGVYYVSESLFHFKDSVKIVNPDYIMTSDTMDYNTETETSFFNGPTELNGDSLYLYCEKGWYDTKYDITSIWTNALIDNRKQVIYGDSLFFNDSTGFGESFRNVVIKDTSKNIIIKGNYAWFYKESEKFMITDRAMFVQISDGDSLFLHADTINAVTVSDTLDNNFRLVRAYYGCRIFSENFQAKCDSLSYSFQDSVIRLYTSPIIWSEENQLTADSMAVFTKNKQTDRLELYNGAFVTSQVDTIRFNQIKGRALTGYFDNNKLYKIDIQGNGETIYYLMDGENISGINQSECANIEILVVNGKISEIYEHQNPEGVIDPPDPSQPEPLRLTDFNWFDSIRPKEKNDIFIKQKEATLSTDSLSINIHLH